MSRKFATVATLCATLALGACASRPSGTAEEIDAALKMRPDPVTEYRLGASDTVSVSVWRNPELSVAVPVRPDGKISVPLVGDVVASGKTPEDLGADIKNKLSLFVRDPQVTVIVTEMTSYEFRTRVRATGAFKQPLSLAYREGMTVLDLVLTAGGVNEFAVVGNATLYREVNGKVIAIPVDLEAIIQQGDITTNYSLVPGDIFAVPERAF